MSVNLQKGQKVNLSKENAGLSTICVGLGWDEAKKEKKGFLNTLFGSVSGDADIDCDASAILLKNDKMVSDRDLVFFRNLNHHSGAIKHMGDNLTGAGDGDDEQIIVDLKKIPNGYNKIVFVVNIYQAAQRSQQFGMIKNAFIRLVDANNNTEICRYNLSEDYTGMTAMIFGEVYLHNGEWKFNAVGNGTKDNSIQALCERFK